MTQIASGSKYSQVMTSKTGKWLWKKEDEFILEFDINFAQSSMLTSLLYTH